MLLVCRTHPVQVKKSSQLFEHHRFCNFFFRCIQTAMSDINYQHLLIKPLTVGAVAWVYSTYMGGPDGNDGIELFGQKLSLPLATAAGVVLSSAAAEVAHSVVFPHIEPVGKVWSSAASEVFAIAASTAVLSAVFTLGNSGAVGALGIANLATTATVAEVAGSYLYDKFLAPIVFNDDMGYDA
jgi:hypothetical protein